MGLWKTQAAKIEYKQSVHKMSSNGVNRRQHRLNSDRNSEQGGGPHDGPRSVGQNTWLSHATTVRRNYIPAKSVERREWDSVGLFSLTMAYTPTLTKWKVGSNLTHHHIVCSTRFAETDELLLKGYPILYDEANSRQMPALALHCCNNCTCHISTGRETKISVDARFVGFPAIFTHLDVKTKEEHIGTYGSLSLTQTEQRNSQAEPKAQAVVWACDHQQLYIYANLIIIYNNH